jgi:hypothetical protein
MATLAEVSDLLRKFEIAGCTVRRRDNIAFTTQNWDVTDSMVPRPTMMFFHYRDEPKADQWAVREWDQMTGIHGCACFKPGERYVFVSDPGEVYVNGMGDDGDEPAIDSSSKQFFSSVKCVAGGFAYAAGLGRAVYKRTAPGKWKCLSGGTMTAKLPADLDRAGFEDVDGFSDTDLYACGGRGDLWHYDGKKWSREDVPTNANLTRICCAADGKVYVTTNIAQVLTGRSGTWKLLKADTDDPFVDIVDFDSRVLISTDDAILEVKGSAVVPAKLGVPKMTLYSHLASRDGVLLVAGSKEAFLFDGKKWHKIFQL